MQIPFMIMQQPGRNVLSSGTGKNDSGFAGNVKGVTGDSATFLCVLSDVTKMQTNAVNKLNNFQVKIISEDGMDISDSLSEDVLQMIMEAVSKGFILNMDGSFSISPNLTSPGIKDFSAETDMEHLALYKGEDEDILLLKQLFGKEGNNNAELFSTQITGKDENSRMFLLLKQMAGKNENTRDFLLLKQITETGKSDNNKTFLLLKQVAGGDENNRDFLLVRQFISKGGEKKGALLLKELPVKKENNKENLLLKHIVSKGENSKDVLLPKQLSGKNEGIKGDLFLKQIAGKDENNTVHLLSKQFVKKDGTDSILKNGNKTIQLKFPEQSGDKLDNSSHNMEVKIEPLKKTVNNFPEQHKKVESSMFDKGHLLRPPDNKKGNTPVNSDDKINIKDFTENKTDILKPLASTQGKGQTVGAALDGSAGNSSYVKSEKDLIREAGERLMGERTKGIKAEHLEKKVISVEPENKDNMSFLNSRTSGKVISEVLSGKAKKTFQQPDQSNVVGQIVKKAVLGINDGQKSIKIHLEPEYLGRIELKISITNRQVILKILTENPLSKEIIENNIVQLKTDLSNQGLGMEKVEVFVNDEPGYGKKGYDRKGDFRSNSEENSGNENMEEPGHPVLVLKEEDNTGLIGVFA